MIEKYNQIRNKNFYLNKFNYKSITNKPIIKKILYKNADICVYILYKYIIYKMQIVIFNYFTKSKFLLFLIYIGIYINYLYTYKNNLIIPYKIEE